MKILIVGDQGIGKSRIGEALAARLGVPLIDDWDGECTPRYDAVMVSNIENAAALVDGADVLLMQLSRINNATGV